MKSDNKLSFGPVGRGVPAEPFEHMKPLMCTLVAHFRQGTNRGLAMLRLTGDGSPYQSKVRVLSHLESYGVKVSLPMKKGII